VRRRDSVGARSSDGYGILGRASETQGLLPTLLQTTPSRCLRIPMRPEARSLNLACSVAIAAYEARRQICVSA